jgi:hypothetical protein
MDVKAATTEPAAFDPGFPIILILRKMQGFSLFPWIRSVRQSGKASKIVCHQTAEWGALPEALSN